MCRHLAYLGPPKSLRELVLAPAGGLYEQAWRPRRQLNGTVNADGFGLGWYPEDDGDRDPGHAAGEAADREPRPARYRRAVPIWGDANLPDLARSVRTRALLAAVRDATPGTAPDESAAAPFRAPEPPGGPWLFSHNGAVPDWTALPADLAAVSSRAAALTPDALLALEARSDSGLLWALLLNRLHSGEPLEAALPALCREVLVVRPSARLNLLVTDGRSIAAVRRGDSLWYRAGRDSVLVASEPDGEPDAETDAEAGTGAREGGWREVPEGSLVLARPGEVAVRPLWVQETASTAVPAEPSPAARLRSRPRTPATADRAQGSPTP